MSGPSIRRWLRDCQQQTISWHSILNFYRVGVFVVIFLKQTFFVFCSSVFCLVKNHCLPLMLSSYGSFRISTETVVQYAKIRSKSSSNHRSNVLHPVVFILPGPVLTSPKVSHCASSVTLFSPPSPSQTPTTSHLSTFICIIYETHHISYCIWWQISTRTQKRRTAFSYWIFYAIHATGVSVDILAHIYQNTPTKLLCWLIWVYEIHIHQCHTHSVL